MMSISNKIRRLAFVFLFSLLLLLVVNRSANAQALVRGDHIPAGSVYDNDAFLTGTEINVDGTVKGDVFAFGGTVNINGHIEGSLVTAGGTVNLNGQIDGSVYAIALDLLLDNAASIGRSVYFIGTSIVSQPESQVERDLAAVSLGAQLTGTVVRDVRTVVGLDFFRLLLNQADLQAGQLIPEDETSWLPLNQAVSAIETSAGNQSLGKLNISNGQEARGEAIQNAQEEAGEGGQNIGDWATRQVRQFISFLIVGGLLVWLRPKRLDGWSKKLRAKPLSSGGHGLVVFIVGFVGAVILLFLVLGVGLFFRFLTLRMLALTIWGIGLSGLWLSFSIFLLFVIFISKIVVSYLLGLIILERIFPKAARRRILPLLLGLIIYILLTAVPILGWAVGFLAIFFGLGAVWLGYRNGQDVFLEPELAQAYEEE